MVDLGEPIILWSYFKYLKHLWEIEISIPIKCQKGLNACSVTVIMQQSFDLLDSLVQIRFNSIDNYY